MIKRPLVWILGAFLFGMYLAGLKLSIILIFIFMFLTFLATYLAMFRIKKKIISSKDSFLWCLPILFLIGFLAMQGQLKRPVLYEAFGQEISCELSGEITLVVEKPKGMALYVKKVKVILQEGGTYYCENVIINSTYGQDESINQIESNNQAKSNNQDESNNKEDASATSYLIGNEITVQGTLQKFSPATNPGQFDEQLYYQIENIDFKMEAAQITITDAGYSRYHVFLSRIKNKLIRVYSSILSDKEAGTLIAMLLGEKYLLDSEIKKLYQENGISHILAISGLHVSLIGMFVFGLLKRLKCPITFATFFTIFFVYSYGVLTNFSVSTNRSVVMMIVLLLSSLIGKTYDMLSATALSALIILLQNPLQILSAGFLLSYGAVLGISMVYPVLKNLFPAKNMLANGLLISISAQTTTTPFVIWYFYQFPVYGVLTNLIILPLITVLTLTSILAGMVGAVYLPFGVFLIGGANYILKFYEWVCRFTSSLPCNLITVGKPDILRMLLYFFLLGVFLWTARKYHKKFSVILLIAAMLPLFLPRDNAGLEVTFLDVGQGDAIYMESAGGTTYLIDGGSADISKVGTYRLWPFLKSEGTDRLDYAIMTHSDSDHINGLIELIGMKDIKIKNLILPDIIDKDEAYIELETLALEKGITVKYIKAGDVILDGDIRMVCLHPAPGYKAITSNSYSTVLSITYGEFDMLLTGDLQKDGEELIMELLNNQDYWAGYDFRLAKDYDILKVAHHGSKSSSVEEFLSLIKPEIGIISCGKNNYYGHPHAELLDRLEEIDSDIKITYETGAVTLKTDGVKLEIEEFIKE